MDEAETENMLFSGGSFYRWVTNTQPDSQYIMGLDPKTFVLGEPVSTSAFTTQQMILEGLVGVYVKEE